MIIVIQRALIPLGKISKSLVFVKNIVVIISFKCKCHLDGPVFVKIN